MCDVPSLAMIFAVQTVAIYLMYIHIVVCVHWHVNYSMFTLSSYVAIRTFKQMTPQLTPSNWMQLFNCTTWYPSRVMLSLPI